jgi:hypothetical protein
MGRVYPGEGGGAVGLVPLQFPAGELALVFAVAQLRPSVAIRREDGNTDGAAGEEVGGTLGHRDVIAETHGLQWVLLLRHAEGPLWSEDSEQRRDEQRSESHCAFRRDNSMSWGSAMEAETATTVLSSNRSVLRRPRFRGRAGQSTNANLSPIEPCPPLASLQAEPTQFWQWPHRSVRETDQHGPGAQMKGIAAACLLIGHIRGFALCFRTLLIYSRGARAVGGLDGER